MKIFWKERQPGGKRNIYFCGVKIYSYRHKKTGFAAIYARRFDENISLQDKKAILTHQFQERAHYTPDLDNPKTFNEKIQWMKLYDHNPLYTLCTDKYLVREHIKEKIGEKYLNNLLGVWDNPDDIDFDKLPDRFVLKVNWGSGQNIIVPNKSELDVDEARKQLRKWIQPYSNHYYSGLEWQYKNIKPKIIAEEFLESLNENSALDYKFMCFGGKPYLCWITNKNKKIKERCFYDMDWNKTDIELVEPGKVMAKDPVKKPECFDEMVQIAKTLSAGFPHVRVDLYLLKSGDIKFGELTFSSASGYSPWSPEDVDRKLGDLIDLSKVKKDI